jgi:hypothetical protein
MLVHGSRWQRAVGEAPLKSIPNCEPFRYGGVSSARQPRFAPTRSIFRGGTLLKDVAMSGIPDNENAPPYRKFGATDHRATCASGLQHWLALLFF